MKKIIVCVLAAITLLMVCSCNNSNGTLNPGGLIECPSCGEATNANANFCQQCGSSLEGGGGVTGGQPGSSDCSICAYDGFNQCQGHDCISCDGTGYIKCYGCVNGYTAYGLCDFCNGGKIDCTCDDGVRYYDKPYYVPDSDVEYCSECEGGYVECSYCDGSGQNGTYTVGGFDGADGAEVPSACPRCGGRKKVLCSKCGGDGEL